MKRVSTLSFFLIWFLFFVTLFTFAPSTSAQTAESDVTVDISPSIPAPNQNVTITLTSFSLDLNKSTISWKLNGAIKNSSIGAKTFSFTAGNIGTQTTIDIAIIVNSSTRIDKKIIIEPSEVDLLWEAKDSYVPPFYKGKALPASEALIKVTAVPNGGSKNIDSKSLVYSWKRNFVSVPDESGYGKSTLSFRTSYLNQNERISLEASGVSQKYGASGDLSVTTSTPKIIFYEDSPLLGIGYNKALNNGYRLSESEATIIAEPYFFSPKNPASNDLTYTWSLNDNKITTPVQKNELVVRGGGQSGRAKVELSIESVPKLFQLAKQYFFIYL